MVKGSSIVDCTSRAVRALDNYTQAKVDKRNPPQGVKYRNGYLETGSVNREVFRSLDF